MPRHRIRQQEKLQRIYLKEWREFRGFSQDELIARLPENTLSKASLSRIENGKQVYTQDVLQMLARVLGVSVVDILIRHPNDPEGIWSVWEAAKPQQRRQLVELGKALLRVDAE